MQKIFLLAVLFLGAAGLSSAHGGWQRSGSLSGPRGTVTTNAGGSCANGSCARYGTVTGPNGGTYNRQGTTSCAGGACTRQSTVTGPYGYSRTGSSTATWQTPN